MTFVRATGNNPIPTVMQQEQRPIDVKAAKVRSHVRTSRKGKRYHVKEYEKNAMSRSSFKDFKKKFEQSESQPLTKMEQYLQETGRRKVGYMSKDERAKRAHVRRKKHFLERKLGAENLEAGRVKSHVRTSKKGKRYQVKEYSTSKQKKRMTLEQVFKHVQKQETPTTKPASILKKEARSMELARKYSQRHYKHYFKTDKGWEWEWKRMPRSKKKNPLRSDAQTIMRKFF
jgi:hypothetical protein